MSKLLNYLKSNITALLVLAFVLAGGAIVLFKGMDAGPANQGPEIIIPELSAAAQAGAEKFAKNCAKCHGEKAGGTDTGPPLIHKVYNPGHHSDAGFYNAVKRGVRQHHWPFGDMPPQPQVSFEDAKQIVRFVREVQRANGITNTGH